MTLSIRTSVKHRPTASAASQTGTVKQQPFSNSYVDTAGIDASSVRRLRVSGATAQIDPFEDDYLSVFRMAIKVLGEPDAFEGLYVGATSTDPLMRIDPGTHVVFRPANATTTPLWARSVSGATISFQVITWGLTAAGEGGGV